MKRARNQSGVISLSISCSSIDNFNSFYTFVTLNLIGLSIDERENRFKEFYIRYFLKIKKFINVYLNDESMSENIAQDIFIKIYSERYRLMTDESLLPYLYVAAKNRCMNELRRRKTMLQYSADAEYKFRTDLSIGDLGAQHDLKVIKDVFWKTLNTMPEATKEAFLLHREGGMKYQEIADMMGVSIKTIEYRISFALKRLREAFDEIS